MSTTELDRHNGTAKILKSPDTPHIWGLKVEDRLQKQLKNIKPDNSVLLLRGDVIYEDAVLHGLKDSSNTLLVLDNGERLGANVSNAYSDIANAWLRNETEPPKDLTTATPDQIGSAYNSTLRKRKTPKAFPVTRDNASNIERQLYNASYKGVTDLVTKYLWPVPAYYATKVCARIGLSPNMVTSIGAVLMLAALWLFAEGHFGWGLLAGWVMTFLDTVDGKLARVTQTSSQWGGIFDHGIDLLHPPFWYIAWGLGLDNAGYPMPDWLMDSLWIMFITYVVGRLCEGYFIRRFGFHLHVWRSIDSFFRLIVARRNPNMIILTLAWVAGRADIGLLLVVIWTAAAVPVHLIQIAQAQMYRSAGKPVTSWLSS